MSLSFATDMEKSQQDYRQTEILYDVEKHGNFDEKTWLEIFNHLDDYTLANVAAVCQQFKALARKVYKIRNYHYDRCIVVDAGNTDIRRLKLVMCRFKDIITDVQLVRQSELSSIGKKLLGFIEEFLSDSVKCLTLGLGPGTLNNMNFRKKFLKLEQLHILGLTEMKAGHPITRLNQWCPNLNRLILTVTVNKHFFRQSVPSLKIVQFRNCDGINKDDLCRFFATNNQLKEVSYEMMYPTVTDETHKAMSFLEVVNTLLINVETITISATTLDQLPCRFNSNFANLKSLSFLMSVGKQGYGTCKDQLLRIVSNLPNIEELKVANCSENAMTNENLVELIDRSGLTLKKLHFSSKKTYRALKFGYDLHRQIYTKTDKSGLYIGFEFGCIWIEKLKRFDITKDGIWEDRKLIVLAPRLENY